VETAVHDTIKEAVRAVVLLTDDGHGDAVTYTAVARHLKLDKSSARRRCETAEAKGYLVNLQTEEGRPAKLMPGEPLPGAHAVLPAPAALAEAVSSGTEVAHLPATVYRQRLQGDTPGGGGVISLSTARGDAWEDVA
jgi:hypothetical protein